MYYCLFGDLKRYEYGYHFEKEYTCDGKFYVLTQLGYKMLRHLVGHSRCICEGIYG